MTADAPAPAPPSRADILAQLPLQLLERGLITQEKREELEHRDAWAKEPLDEVVLRENLVAERVLLEILSGLSGLPLRPAGRSAIDPAALACVPPKVVAAAHVMPVALDHGVLVLATERLREQAEEDELRVALGYPLRWVLCTRQDLAENIKHFYGVGLEAFLGIHPATDKRREGDEDPGVPAFVRAIIEDAIRSGATDVHLEPQDERFRVRYRIDGVLNETPLPKGVDRLARAVVSSIKVLAQMNVAERRLPQDGRFELPLGRQAYDLRVSVLPSRLGETVNLRILNRESNFLSLGQLGMSDDQRRDLEALITLPHGIVLFTGPTGSGKTTSLYAALALLNRGDRKIITLEDPVEYQVPGITQIQIESGIGLTFAGGLRSILRHDPNVVLVGEIRDEETADIAVRAALTGHMVFSTLHTNDSASAVARLVDMGVEPYLVASSLQGVVAQRLMRLVCRACRETHPLDPALAPDVRHYFPALAEIPPVARGAGCPECRFTGYRGRTPVFELLEVRESIRPLIIERVPSVAILRQARAAGLVTLRQRAWELVLSGRSSVQELLRVTRRERTD